MALSNLHLVDDEGQPLDPCVVEAVTRFEPRIRQKFGRYCDPAVFSSAIEGKARRIAATEKEKREKGAPPSDAEEVRKLTWTALWNLGVSFVRKWKNERVALASLALESVNHSVDDDSEVIIARRDGHKILSQLSARDREICDLEVLHWSDEQIAKHLGISPAAVRQARHRRNEKIAALRLRYNLKP